jgi:hypothetical protein
VPVSSLPLVICGPMLRRVAPSSVTVFLALKESRNVLLRVYASDAPNAPAVLAGTATTSRLGDNLHVVCVTATAAGQATLAPGTLYRYQCFFAPSGAAATSPHLFTAGVTAATETAARDLLTYPGAGSPVLPSFVTPPADPGQLRLFHGSCRKPHGPADDMLGVVDGVVAQAVTDLTRRPHQLILTGDQIYADDVADPVLAVIVVTATALRIRQDRLRDKTGTRDLTEAEKSVGHRLPTVLEQGAFSTEYGASHLMTFAEFAVMYLLAWTDVLWPATLPSFPDVHPGEWSVLGDAYQSVVDGGAPWYAGFKGKAFEEAVAICVTYHEQLRQATQFKAGQRAVRRLLANTPTLMMLDDHEITDDWYRTREWSVKAVLAPPAGSALGRRIIQNGLAAFAVFQAWGNTPDRFATGTPGAALLDALATWDGEENATSAQIATRVGLPSMFSDGDPVRPSGALGYHFSLSWTNYQLVVLDTRTTRSFRLGWADPPALLWSEDQYAGVPDVGPEGIVVVVSPAPVVGMPLVEDIAQPAAVVFVDAKTSVSSPVRFLGGYKPGADVFDVEAWASDEGAYHRLLGGLLAVGAPGSDGVRRRRVVLLSGDVHYGYSARLRYSARQRYQGPAGRVEGVLVQLTSSALHNQEFPKTEALHIVGYLGLQPHVRFACWANPTGRPLEVGTRVQIVGTNDAADPIPAEEPWYAEGSPAVARLSPLVTLTADPEWQLGIDYLNDPRPMVYTPPATPVPDPGADPMASLHSFGLLTASAMHVGETERAGKAAVGRNNVAEIGFRWGAGDDKEVVQTFWWRPLKLTAAPLTEHRASLATGLAGTAGAALYGGFTLRDGDRDAAGGQPGRYDGVPQPAGASAGHVAALQTDLRELGFLLVGPVTGVFDRHTRWAVRELQTYARGGTVARDRNLSPRAARWAENLEAVAVPAAQRHPGPTSGVVDLATQAVIQRWKQNRWRCPVVVEAWTLSGGTPSAIAQIPAGGGQPARPADNLWRHDELPDENKRVLVYDFTGRYGRAGRTSADSAQPPDPPGHTVLGKFEAYSKWGIAWGGGVAMPPRNVWKPQAEMLPEHLLPRRPSDYLAPTLAQLAAAANRAPLSTYKVVRAVAEVEAIGYFDVYTAYDTAFVSCGPCHWTAGPVARPDPATTPAATWPVEEGELWAYLSYLREKDPAAFAAFAGDTGLGVVDRWGTDGRRLFETSQRKYTSRATLTDESGMPQPVRATVAEHDIFRGWHWLYRVSMAGRTNDGFRRRMWHMARQRVADILAAPWDPPNAAPTIPGLPATSFSAPRRATVGDVFTSERAVGMLLRWHVLSPRGIVREGPPSEPFGTRWIGRAGPAARDALQRARDARPDLTWSGAPSGWGDQHEAALIAGLLAESVQTGGSMQPTIAAVHGWPNWTATSNNGFEWSLPLTDLPTAERTLRTQRGSFLLDRTELPNGATS